MEKSLFAKQLKEASKSYRKYDPKYTLNMEGSADLLNTPIITDLHPVIVKPHIALFAFLEWGREQIFDDQLKKILTLYWEEKTENQICYEFNFHRSTYYRCLDKIQEALEQILWQELTTPTHLVERRTIALLQQCDKLAKSIINLCSLIEGEIVLNHLLLSLKNLEKAIGQKYINQLISWGVLQIVDAQLVSFDTTIADEWKKRLDSQERINAHKLAVSYYHYQKNPRLEAWHYQQAGNEEKSAELVLGNIAHISRDQYKEWYQLLDALTLTKFDKNERGRLILAKAKLSELLFGLSRARTFYETLLSHDFPELIRAEAYAELGDSYSQSDKLQAQHYFSKSIALFEQLPLAVDGEKQLFIKALIWQAWISLETEQDLPKAKKRLDEVELLLGDSSQAHWMESFCAWHNALGKYEELCKNGAKSAEHRIQAYHFAQAIQNKRLRVECAHNVAETYTWEGKFELAQQLLTQAKQEAKEIEYLRMHGMLHKIQGVWYALQNQHQEAIVEYKNALDYFSTTGYQKFWGYTYADLAESNVMTGNISHARQHYSIAQQVAIKQEDVVLIAYLNKLKQSDTYPELSPEFALDPQQCAIVAFIRREKFIKSRDAASVSLSKEQLIRELNTLIKKGVVEKLGVGPSTKYRLKPT